MSEYSHLCFPTFLCDGYETAANFNFKSTDATGFCVSQTVSSSTRTSMLFSPACLEKIRNSAVLFLMRSVFSLGKVFSPWN
jgi:hypothetical protein